MNPARVSVVTGGASGIGREICSELLARGDTVISLALEAGDLKHERFEARRVDLTDRQATAAVARDISLQYSVHTLVHNAGAIRPAMLAEARPEDLDALVNLHLGSAIQLAQAFLPGMRAAHVGRIVLIASRAALGLPGRTHYSATKAGLIGLARTWALELAADQILVNAIAPGPILAPPDMNETESAAVVQNTPLGRWGGEAEIAKAVLFLVHSDFVTGETIRVDGGRHVR